MDDIIELIGGMLFLSTAFFVCYCHKKKRNRRFKTRLLNRKSHLLGAFRNIVKESETIDQEQYFKYTRMSPQMFQYILNLITPFIQRQPRVDTITPAHRLSITLHYLPQGTSRQEAAWNNFIGKTTCSQIINETCEVLWHVLCPLVMPVPTKEDYKNIAKEFFWKWNMPNCIGAIDGKLVNVQCPPKSGSAYFSYKKKHSMILLAACEAYYRFTMVDIGTPGSEGDSFTFGQSKFGQQILQGALNLPEETPLPNSNITLPHFLVADQAFPLHKNIMRPYPGQYLSEDRNIFNYRLSRARRTIENAFGILVQRWRVLRTTIIASEEHCISVIKACVVLHNLLQKGDEDIPLEERKYCPTGFADHLDSEGNLIDGSWRKNNFQLSSIGRLGTNNCSRRVTENREQLKQYFVSDEGAISNQWNVVNYGGIP